MLKLQMWVDVFVEDVELFLHHLFQLLTCHLVVGLTVLLMLHNLPHVPFPLFTMWAHCAQLRNFMDEKWMWFQVLHMIPTDRAVILALLKPFSNARMPKSMIIPTFQLNRFSHDLIADLTEQSFINGMLTFYQMFRTTYSFHTIHIIYISTTNRSKKNYIFLYSFTFQQPYILYPYINLSDPANSHLLEVCTGLCRIRCTSLEGRCYLTPIARLKQYPCTLTLTLASGCIIVFVCCIVRRCIGRRRKYNMVGFTLKYVNYICYFLSPPMRKSLSPTTSQSRSRRTPSVVGKDSQQQWRGIGDSQQKLTKKLQTYLTMYKLNQPLKCLQHNSYLSLYNKLNHQLVCANCFQQACQGTRIHKMIPMEQAQPNIQADIEDMEVDVGRELRVLTEMEDVLYEGYEDEQSSLKATLQQIEELEEEVVKRVQEHFQGVTNKLLALFKKQHEKHETILNQLHKLKQTVSNTLTILNTNNAHSQHNLFKHEMQRSILCTLKFSGHKWNKHINPIQLQSKQQVKHLKQMFRHI